MRNLIVVGFDGENKADEVLLELLHNDKTCQLDREDVAVFVRKNDGQMLVKHVHPLVTAMAARRSSWGLQIGFYF